MQFRLQTVHTIELEHLNLRNLLVNLFKLAPFVFTTTHPFISKCKLQHSLQFLPIHTLMLPLTLCVLFKRTSVII